MKLNTTIQRTGGNTTGILIPGEVVEALGAGRKPKVRATINGYAWRSSIAFMRGEFWLGISAAVREAAGVAGDDAVELELEVDEAPREVEVPADLAEALAAESALQAKFDKLSYTLRKEQVRALVTAKAPETRARRLDNTLRMLREG